MGKVWDFTTKPNQTVKITVNIPNLISAPSSELEIDKITFQNKRKEQSKLWLDLFLEAF